ncbi:MAG: hypothetical protein ABI591_10625 [Kofleriaceae bacterium]
MSTAPHADQPAPVVTARAANEWLLEVTRTQGARSAKAAIVIAVVPSATTPAPRLEVASAQAWLALARGAMELHAPTDAVAAARAGIADLGESYRPKRVEDDTGLHVLDANGAVAAGSTDEGARSLISVLDARIGLYVRRYETEARPQ